MPKRSTPIRSLIYPTNAAADLRGLRLNSIPFATVRPGSWKPGDTRLSERPLPTDPNLRIATGCVVREPDGRYWLAEPTDHYLGLWTTFPGGGLEDDLSPQQNARKETLEETGLLVRITAWLGDIVSDYGFRRYYLATRIGGIPGDMRHGHPVPGSGVDETQAVHLATFDDAWERLNSIRDRNLLLWADQGRRGQLLYVPSKANVQVVLPPTPSSSPAPKQSKLPL